MANILEKIVADKKIEIEQLKKEQPLESFIDTIKPSKKDFYGAISRQVGENQANFILECKKASPSKGLIRPDFDVQAISHIYEKYAAAISVLTDKKYFQGSYDFLRTVTSTVACPVLNKDFFIDPYQVYLARHAGADAILLMLSVLSDQQYKALSAIADSLNLGVLTEISNEQERDRAIALNAKLIGINNRNLRDLTTDISQTFKLAPTIPNDRIVISESGIYTNDQVRELAPAVDGFLVGSSLMSQLNIDKACRQLIYGNHKICGLSQPEHASDSRQAGARFGGLIFAEKSPRYVTLAKAEKIVAHEMDLDYVGVFVNESATTIANIAKQLALFAVQLHGNENEAYILQLKALLPESCQIWKAISVDSTMPRLNLPVDHYVLDGKNAGSGQSFNWQLFDEDSQSFNTCLLAGGLNEQNIKQAIGLLNDNDFFGLDINSGVESAPAIKSTDKINAVFNKIRQY